MDKEIVACYIRVSTQEQKLHGISLDAQRDKLLEYADKNNLQIYKWYEDEGISGRKLIRKRPALQEMLNDAKSKKFSRIIFIKLDRFFRSVAEYHECMKYISPVIWTATEEKYDLTTASGRAFVNMKLTIAELEADQTGERIKLVNDYKIKNGQALTGSQSQGFAYTVEKIDGVKKVVKDKSTSDIVYKIINFYLYDNSKRDTISYINNLYGDVISYRSLGKLLKDTKLYGYYKGNPNYCEPYIDKETFNLIQEKLNKNQKYPASGRIYLFSGLIYCPCCGTRLVGAAGSSVKRGQNGKIYHNQKITISYRCNKNVIDKKCNFNRRPNQEKIEKQLITLFDEYLKQNDFSDNFNNLISLYLKDMDDKSSKKIMLLRNINSKNWLSAYYKLTDLAKKVFWHTFVNEIKIDENTLKIISVLINTGTNKHSPESKVKSRTKTERTEK